MTHVYAFGSIIRGEIDNYSDIDLLAIANSYNPNFSVEKFSIYSEKRLLELWKEGNPFAWHLHHESKLLFSSDGNDPLLNYGAPNAYRKGPYDCLKFYELFINSQKSLIQSRKSACFELSAIFLSLRNFATCYVLYLEKENLFSRRSALMLGDKSAPISIDDFDICMRARALSTRGIGETISKKEIEQVINTLPSLQTWMEKLLGEVNEK